MLMYVTLALAWQRYQCPRLGSVHTLQWGGNGDCDEQIRTRQSEERRWKGCAGKRRCEPLSRHPRPGLTRFCPLQDCTSHFLSSSGRVGSAAKNTRLRLAWLTYQSADLTTTRPTLTVLFFNQRPDCSSSIEFSHSSCPDNAWTNI